MAAVRVGAVRPDGTAYTRAVAGAFEVTRLVFPPNFRHGAVEPDRGYMVVVLDGSVHKSFVRDSATLSCGSFATLPEGATHSSSFASNGAQILALRPTDAEARALFGSLLTRHRHVRAASSTELGWRIAGELESQDASSGLAIEGLILQLLAVAERGTADPSGGRASWLHAGARSPA